MYEEMFAEYLTSSASQTVACLTVQLPANTRYTILERTSFKVSQLKVGELREERETKMRARKLKRGECSC